MDDDQVDRLLEELGNTRTSFDNAILAVRWNKINTIILYSLMAIVFVLGSLIFMDYRNTRHKDCVASNEFRATVFEVAKANALAVGNALAVVLGGSADDVNEYMTAYEQQAMPGAFEPREC